MAQLVALARAHLVAAKSHAAGCPGAARRATKHAGDLYDILRHMGAAAATPLELDRMVDVMEPFVAALG